MITLTASQIALITGCPIAAAVIAIACIAIKIIKAYTAISKAVADKVDKATVTILIEELRREKKENARMRKVLVEAIEATTKVNYGDSHDDDGNKKI